MIKKSCISKYIRFNYNKKYIKKEKIKYNISNNKYRMKKIK